MSLCGSQHALDFSRVLYGLCSSWMHTEEGTDVFKVHGVGGMVGAFLTGIFASQSVAGLDGVTEATGGIDGNEMQVGKQLAEVCAISAYSFIVSCILLCILQFIPGKQLRVHEKAEMIGLDRAQFVDEQVGERALLDNLFALTSPVSASVANAALGAERRVGRVQGVQGMRNDPVG